MPHFCPNCGADEYICQKCGRIRCSSEYPSQWRTDITKKFNAGNVCPDCIAKHETFVAPRGPAAKEPTKPAGRMLRPVIDEELAKEIEKGREYEKQLMKPEIEDKKSEQKVDETLKKILGNEYTDFYGLNEGWRNVKRVSSTSQLPNRYVKIHATPIKETEKAILFKPSRGPITAWLPKSQLYIVTGNHVGLDLISFYGPTWLLKKTGIL